MTLTERLIEQVNDFVLVDRNCKSHSHEVIHLLVRSADRLHRDEAEVLATHPKTELKGLVGSHVHEVRHLEFADVVLVLVDIVVLEPDGVLVNPDGLALQSRREIEGFGRNVLTIFHLEQFGVTEAHHDRLASSNHTGGVAVQEGQQVLTDRLDALDEGF